LFGNHDAYYKNTNETNSLDFLGLISHNENITIINNKPFFISVFNKSLGLFPWASEINYLLDENNNKKTVEKCNYGFGHFEANGFEQNGQSSVGNKLNNNDLFNLADYLFSGHYHKNKVYYDLLTNTPKLQMVGSTMQLNWGEYRTR